MKPYSLSIALAALAAALLLCCSQFEFDNPYDPDNWPDDWKSSSSFWIDVIPPFSSSSISSSSSRPSSSSSLACGAGYFNSAYGGCALQSGYGECLSLYGAVGAYRIADQICRNAGTSMAEVQTCGPGFIPNANNSECLPYPSSSSGSAGSPSSGSGGGRGNNISNYRIQTIGTQTWMAENLDFYAPGSKCYDNLESNCSQYGRLYDWATAMALPSYCNSSTCASQVSAKHQGICPSGWHIPSDDDWEALFSYVGGSSVAGKHLKATSGWNSYSGIVNLDSYGFAALPGGSGYSDGYFYGAGNYGFWWSASEGGSYYAYGRDMGYNSEYAYWGSYSKTGMYSVRCLQD